MKTNGPPLKVWFYFFFAFFAFQIIVYCYVKPKIKKVSYSDDKTMESALKDLKSSDEKSIKVVIIGSSLVGCGVECREEMNSAISSQKAPLVHLTKVWGSGDPYFRMIENDKLLDKLIEIRPDLICFQTELVAVNFDIVDPNLTGLNQSLIITSLYNKMAINYLRQNPDANKNVPRNGQQCVPDREDIKMDTTNYKPINRSVKKHNDIKFAFNDLKKLQRAGIKTVIVDLPKPVKVEEKFFNTPFMGQLQQVLDMYQQQFGIEYWKYTGQPMYYRHFIDGGHLNKSGRHIYTEWLLEKIKQEKVL
ncbi:hypothetical protein [Pedobacter gandavensis]|uniref:hypothetical protein n=1 Tax=Pedobacter gandavensis TaxID=2679963 RepID=UPI00292D1E7C|nr:hypothetical protein [Pedobacter gandavensis]